MLVNERSFDRLFCDLYEASSFDLYFNESFKDDPVFNHVVIRDSILSSSNNENLEQTSMLLHEIKTEALRRNFSPTLFVEDFWRKSQFLQKVAVEDEYFVGGFMEILSKVVKNLPESRSKTIVEGSIDFKLWNQIFVNSYSIPHTWEGELLRREKLFSTFRDTKLFIARNPQDENVGCMLTQRMPPEYLGVYCVGTLPEMRHQGIASALITKAEKTAADLGCKYLTLQTISSDGVVPLYLKLGFKIEFRRAVLLRR
jgi:ribosomal protein S18 acetylase RimI-like enzyme